MSNLDVVVGRVKSEFMEMPGLRLSLRQAMRLWGLERTECERVIDRLVNESFLQLTPRGDVLRAGSDSTSWAAYPRAANQRTV